jgi:hypothetical protein
MKVPDLFTSQSDVGSLGSEASTTFGMDRQLWTPTMDKPLPTPVEQRIIDVAKATRIQLGLKG